MIKAAGCRGAAILLSLFLTAAAVTGCGGKYEQVPLPAREETQVSESEDAQAPGESVEGAQEGEAGESRMLVLEDAQDVQAAQEADGAAVAEMSSLESGLTTANGFTEVDETVYILEDKVNLRKGCGTQFSIVTQLNTGDSIKRTGYSDGWSRVVYKDKECYVMSEFLSKEDPTGAGGENVMALENQPVQAGAEGISTKLPEYKLTLSVSQKLRRILEERGYKVIMIRESNDVNLSNAERAEIANKSGASIFVRVHANSLDNNSVHGTLSMCQTAKNPYNGNLHAKSYSLSKKITDYVCAATGFKNRGVQETDSMSGINWCTIPVTIIEMGFMSNPEEDQKMAQDDYQELIAAGIANGIDAYFNE